MATTKKPLRRSSKKENTKDLREAESSIPLRTMESIIDSNQIFFSQEDFESWYEELWSASEIKQKSIMQLSRTSLLILDYFQFKAARTIQKYLRRWYYQRIYQRKRTAAIRIQYEWRKFYKERMIYLKLEQETQEAAEKFYFRQAQKIQALWRGWYTRQYIHDHNQLLKSQVLTAEDLLQCVAFKLHHMLRTYQIPGVYSLRNSHCLSKVEKLLAAISFKQHNVYACRLRTYVENRTNNARKKFIDSAYSTAVPYAGANVRGHCEPKCAAIFKAKDMNRRMYKILKMYEEAARTDVQKHRKRSGSRDKEKRGQSPRSKSTDKSKPGQRKQKQPEKKTDFCEDIVNSMKRWSILKDNNVTVDPNIFRRPDKLENFLSEIESIRSLMQDRCQCCIKSPEELCR